MNDEETMVFVWECLVVDDSDRRVNSDWYRYTVIFTRLFSRQMQKYLDKSWFEKNTSNNYFITV